MRIRERVTGIQPEAQSYPEVSPVIVLDKPGIFSFRIVTSDRLRQAGYIFFSDYYRLVNGTN